MHDFLELTDFDGDQVLAILELAAAIKRGTGAQGRPLADRTVLTVFPEASIRTRITFEAGVQRLGAAHVWLPPAILEKDEPLRDIAGYLDCWVDLAVIRCPDLRVLREMAEHMTAPVVNAMTSENHPCEIMSDLLTLQEMHGDLTRLRLAFVGPGGNICNSWFAAAAVLGLSLTQVCPPGYEVDAARFEHAKVSSAGRVAVTNDLAAGLNEADVILTDCWPTGEPAAVRELFLPYQLTLATMALTRKNGSQLHPCPPVTRGQEVSAEVMDSPYFVGYSAKANLLPVQQAVVLSCLGLV